MVKRCAENAKIPVRLRSLAADLKPDISRVVKELAAFLPLILVFVLAACPFDCSGEDTTCTCEHECECRYGGLEEQQYCRFSCAPDAGTLPDAGERCRSEECTGGCDPADQVCLDACACARDAG